MCTCVSVCVCRGKLVKIMERTREYTTPTTSLCFIAHLVVVVVIVVVCLLLLFHLQFVVVAAAVATVFNGCRTFLSVFLCHRLLFDIYNRTGQTRPPPCLPHASLCFPLYRPTFRNVREPVHPLTHPSPHPSFNARCWQLTSFVLQAHLRFSVLFFSALCFVLIAWKLQKLHGKRIVAFATIYLWHYA